MNRRCQKIAAVLIVGAAIALSAPSVRADTFVYDFVTGLDGWSQQWHKSSPTGTAGLVTYSLDRGYLDAASLKFDMGNGLGDDGTLWIEKQFPVSPLLPTRIDLSFEQFNLAKSDLNNFAVKTAIGTADATTQSDFHRIGETGAVQGWVPLADNKTLNAPAGQVWVALGIRVAWETHRDYWIDHVTVATMTVPEPPAAALSLAALTVVFYRHRRESQWRLPRLSAKMGE